MKAHAVLLLCLVSIWGCARNEAVQTSVAPPRPQGVAADEAILKSAAARLPVNGLITVSGKPTLIFNGGRHAAVGAFFTVAYEGRDYDVEVTAISNTTFTIRHGNATFTREVRAKNEPNSEPPAAP